MVHEINTINNICFINFVTKLLTSPIFECSCNCAYRGDQPGDKRYRFQALVHHFASVTLSNSMVEVGGGFSASKCRLSSDTKFLRFALFLYVHQLQTTRLTPVAVRSRKFETQADSLRPGGPPLISLAQKGWFFAWVSRAFAGFK